MTIQHSFHWKSSRKVLVFLHRCVFVPTYACVCLHECVRVYRFTEVNHWICESTSECALSHAHALQPGAKLVEDERTRTAIQIYL